MVRFLLILWITRNSLVEVVPGVSVASWVQMGGCSSMGECVASMRAPRTWVDTPMLVAASGAQCLNLDRFSRPTFSFE
eukprot:2578465-Pyramimonas_sp.AAC.1